MEPGSFATVGVAPRSCERNLRCEPLERRVLLDADLTTDDLTIDEGKLSIVGDQSDNDIQINYSAEGVELILDGQRQLFRDPIHTIEIDAGDGDNLIRYRQTILANVALDIVTGNGEDVIDVDYEWIDGEREASFADSPILVNVKIDAGGGKDISRVKVKFPWLDDQELLHQLDFTANINPGRDAGLDREVGDEVLVSFEHGDANHPVVIGGLWNSTDPPTAEPTTPRVGLRNLAAGFSASPQGLDTHFHLTGGDGDDSFDVTANYSGVRLQQGRVLLDADFNEGDNSLNAYILTSVRHMHVESRYTAGDGDNQVNLTAERRPTSGIQDGTSNTIMISESTLGHGNNILQYNISGYDFIHHRATLGDGDNILAIHNTLPTHRRIDLKATSLYGLSVVAGDGNNLLSLQDMLGSQSDHHYDVRLGDGNNRTELRFGDGVHGARLPTGQRNVTATYRTGSGDNSLETHGNVSFPVAAEFTLDLGPGTNDTVARWHFENAWPKKSSPSHPKGFIKLQIAGGSTSSLDLHIVDTDDPPFSKPKEIVVVASKVEGTFEFLRLVGFPKNPATADIEPIYIPVRRTLVLQNLSADELALTLRHGDSSINMAMSDTTLKRGVVQTNEVAVESLKLTHESFDLELDGLDVRGAAAIAMTLSGAVNSRTAFREVQVNEGASFSHDLLILDITDPANPSPGAAKDGTILISGKKITTHNALELHDLTIGERGRVDIAMNAGNTGSVLAFYQDRVATESFLSTMDVQLRGGDAGDVILAALDGISGEGQYRFTADGGAGDDFIAALAQNLHPADAGNMAFQVLGGAGNDILAMKLLSPTARRGSIFAGLDGGPGFNRCFATANVLIENCDHELDTDDPLLLQLLRRLAGKEYTDEWTTAV